MLHLDECPLCSSSELELLHRPNKFRDFVGAGGVPAEWARSDYSFCGRCGLVSARHRHDPESVADFYDEFKRLERRDYVTYPPPKVFLENQALFADALFESSAARLTHFDAPLVLNLRSECGIVLDRFRRGLGTERVYALDHFETNLRYAEEDLGLPHVAPLMPGTPIIPESWPTQYDLVLVNHMLTHALELRRLMELLKGLLTSGGMLLIYNEVDHAETLLRRGAFKTGLNGFHTQLFSRRSFENLFREFGLEFVDLRAVPPIRWAVPRVSMVVIATAAGPPRELIGDHEGYRTTFEDWARRSERSRRSLLSRAKRGLNSLVATLHPERR